jgi:hypothetical protein
MKEARRQLTAECVPSLAAKTAQLDATNAELASSKREVEHLSQNVQTLVANAAQANKTWPMRRSPWLKASRFPSNSTVLSGKCCHSLSDACGSFSPGLL